MGRAEGEAHRCCDRILRETNYCLFSRNHNEEGRLTGTVIAKSVLLGIGEAGGGVGPVEVLAAATLAVDKIPELAHLPVFSRLPLEAVLVVLSGEDKDIGVLSISACPA